MNLTLILEILAFGAVFGLVLAASRSIAAMATVRRRLTHERSATTPAMRVIRDEKVRNPILAWVESAFLTNPRDRDLLRRDLLQAGYESPTAPTLYVATRFTLAVLLPMLFIMQNSLRHTASAGLLPVLLPIVLAAIGLAAPRMALNAKVKARRALLEDQFPDALDLMVICVEAGLGVDAAFQRVAEETRLSHPQISQELRRLSTELAAGRSRGEAMRHLADRLNIDSVRAFVALLVQSESLGVSAAQSLRTYSAEMRETRYMRAEEKAMRVPVLMTLPLVSCFLPVVVIALMLPTIIDIIRTVVPAMTHSGR